MYAPKYDERRWSHSRDFQCDGKHHVAYPDRAQSYPIGMVFGDDDSRFDSAALVFIKEENNQLLLAFGDHFNVASVVVRKR